MTYKQERKDLNKTLGMLAFRLKMLKSKLEHAKPREVKELRRQAKKIINSLDFLDLEER